MEQKKNTKYQRAKEQDKFVFYDVIRICFMPPHDFSLTSFKKSMQLLSLTSFSKFFF